MKGEVEVEKEKMGVTFVCYRRCFAAWTDCNWCVFIAALLGDLCKDKWWKTYGGVRRWRTGNCFDQG